MRRFIQYSFFLYFALIGTSYPLSSQEEEESPPRLLIPQKMQERPTYNSLTEERGTLKLIKEKKEKEAAQKKDTSAEEENQRKSTQETPTINFNNVSITEVLKYVSRLTGKNFIYDPQELQFSITMISDTPSSLEEIMAMLIQSIRVHGFSIMEEGGSFVIHTNPSVRGAGALYKKDQGIEGPQLATEVFLLQNIDAGRCSSLIKTMISEGAIVETIGNTKLIVSDITENIRRISEVIKQLDSESEGLDIGQYVAVTASPAALASMAERLLSPMSGGKPLVLVPHVASNSVFIVSTSFLIDKALNVMRTIDLNEQRTGILAAQRKSPEEKGRPLTQEEEEFARKESDRNLESMSEDQLKRRLLEQGLDEAQVNALTLDAAREAYKQAKRFIVAGESDLPIGRVESTQFLIFKLQYRKNKEVSTALRSIANSLTGVNQPGGRGGDLNQSDLIITLNSLQDVDDNNTIVFTGTKASLEKVKNLIAQIDLPVRQVFIEALVIDTSLANSLQFGVQWAGKIQRQNLGAGIGFRDPIDTSFGAAFDNTGQTTAITSRTNAAGEAVESTISQVAPPPAPAGFSTGYIGRKIKFLGKGFRSTGALVQALQATSETHIIMNPKIVTEHNVPAEVYVGQQIPIKGQTIANSSIGSTSSVLATNYNTQEIGVSLKVTPLISAHENVTLIIEQQISTANATQVNSQGQGDAPPATVNQARTVTRVHLPSDHFLVMSGLITEQHDLINNRIPCLGGLPIVGAFFGTNTDNCTKRNFMIFIRPVIIDNAIDIDEITKNQDLLVKQKSEIQEGRYKEYDTMKSFLNLD